MGTKWGQNGVTGEVNVAYTFLGWRNGYICQDTFSITWERVEGEETSSTEKRKRL